MDARSAFGYNKQINDDEVPLSVRLKQVQAAEATGVLSDDDILLSERAATAAEFGTSVHQSTSSDARVPFAAADPHSAAPVGKRACLFVHPQKSFSMVWGFLTTIVVLWVVFSLPFKLAYLSERCAGMATD
jgi:hypothetical protein